MSRFNGRIPIHRYRREHPVWEDFERDAFEEPAATAVAPEKESEPEPAVEIAPEPEEDDTQAERLARMRSDFSRYRERVDRERREDRHRAQSDMVLDLLPVIDNFERGLEAARADRASDHVQGFALIHKQLLGTLADLGVRPMRTVGEVFDPNLHESVMREASAIAPTDTIIRELLKGYTRDGEVLRHAQVVVSSGFGGNAQ